MRAEVLYVAECPHRGPAVKLLGDVLISEGIPPVVHEILVADEIHARELQFRGSPTIRINGRDVLPDPQNLRPFGLSCVVNLNPNSASFLSPDAIRSAVRKAGQGEKL